MTTAVTEEAPRYPRLPADLQGLPATMASASVAGLLSRALIHPLDTAKAVIQVQVKAAPRHGVQTLLGSSRTLQTLTSLWRKEGLVGLYRGFGITAGLAVPATCLYFSAYEVLKARLLWLSRSHEEQQQQPEAAAADISFTRALLLDSVCGFTAEAIACLLYLPMDVCKERLQVYTSMQPDAVQKRKPTLADVARMGGLRGLYSGYGATLLSFGPFSALFFTLNHQFGKATSRLLQPAEAEGSSGRPSSSSAAAPSSPLLAASVAGAAGGCAAFLTAPLDKVKLRLQVQVEASAGRRPPFYYKHFFHGLISLCKTEGVAGCFAGVGARTMFHSASLFMTFLFMQNARNLYCRYFEA
ncbi:mitochondrial carrier domain-containing protein, putative [Eimeria mitis]|uniref:Mitochondrial carrier domain-containing protein, putative n=1 Tax=Eimeria mitis TaxID=44415 RepID=U6JSQ6_9EIME|nr:mitochondrial carrier domain-containing protein, putative [Eimeria mitis]CDJ28444.1 mitochondrial carrier domain-containing protein, putative [Eimeria mitis]